MINEPGREGGRDDRNQIRRTAAGRGRGGEEETKYMGRRKNEIGRVSLPSRRRGSAIHPLISAPYKILAQPDIYAIRDDNATTATSYPSLYPPSIPFLFPPF